MEFLKLIQNVVNIKFTVAGEMPRDTQITGDFIKLFILNWIHCQCYEMSTTSSIVEIKANQTIFAVQLLSLFV